MDRRTFLQTLGIAGAATTAGCEGAPLQRLYAYLTPPEDIVPGTPVYYATVCRACPAGCGIIVKTREARPIKLEGNPAHPVNRGALCARGQAFIQGLYGRHRVREPLVRRDGKLVPATWDQALALIGERLKDARSIALMTGLESGSFEDLVADLRVQLPGLAHVVFEPLSFGALRRASKIVYGRDEVPYVDLAAADRVLSLGADFLDSWLSPVALSRQWAEGHGYGRDGRRLTLEYFGPRPNLTSTAADHAHVVPAEAVGAVARALLGAVHRARPSADPAFASLERLLSRPGTPAEAAPPEAQGAAQRLLAARRPVVLHGGAETATVEATLTHVAVLLLDHLLGATGSALRYGLGYALSKAHEASRAYDTIRQAGGRKLDALILYGTNPAYTMPGGLEVGRQLDAARLVVALATEHDETTAHAHVVLPVHHPLESWGDYEVTTGIVGMMQPVRSPLFASRHPGDVLLGIARRVGGKPAFEGYRGYVAARWLRRQVDDLTDVLTVGGRFDESLAAGAEVKPVPDWAKEIPPALPGGAGSEVGGASPAGAGGAAGAGGTGRATLLVAASAALHDGRHVSHDWLLETADSLTQTSWEVPVEVAADVAEGAGIRTGDRVRLAVGGRQLVGVAVVDPDLAKGAVALRLGGGSSRCRERLESGNVLELLDPILDPLSGELALVQTRVAVTRVSPGRVASVSGGSDSRKRFLCLGMEAADARAGHYPTLTRHGEQPPGSPVGPGRLPSPLDDVADEGRRPADNMVPLPRHRRRWFMVVDLDRCTGCGACAVACYAENNVPAVGRQQILMGRELAWMRIEKHVFDGEGRRRRVRFLPVMCQQCLQAPCETVCPVFASYHTPEGLNGQIYNRCIGTRYCANNCPYKVRRFNYFDWPREQPANQQLNPDVTVRSRGVMEKCTFCIHRIRAATNQAKVEGRELRDGEVVPACVQTCPTGALAFGDLKQPGWAIRQRVQDPRGYRLLDHHVNTRPSVLYLRKVYSDPDPSGQRKDG